ncbi:DUF2303 family protein [Sphingobium chungbukense]|uniref:DUF2303 domain-containing protein n=1 Tax=Sphingobium chungbukense TaxID=56193 RepID=A0A0M3AUL5_9SPHN|nr:DUF2303 family protein [Sphingobium chungbukense]KKW93887.1 hypothetical protein YP76_04340 [Sphingobium chungbukense]
MDIDELKGPIGEARDLVEAYVKPVIQTITEPGTSIAAPFAMTPGGALVIPACSFDDYRAQPVRRTGTAELTSLDSLIAHALRFKDEDSAIFASDDRKAPALTVVLDYHRIGAESDPRFGKHKAHFAFPLSDEWKAWTEQNGEALKMVEFAEFLEDRIIDVLYIIPEEDELSDDLQKFINAGGGEATIATPQRLVELARGLQVHESSAVREVRNLSTGEAQISFTSEHTDANGEPLRIPGLFLIGIPVFRNGPIYRIAARLRYRKTPTGVVFWYDLWRTDRVFDHAFKEACQRAEIETDLPLFFGKPE